MDVLCPNCQQKLTLPDDFAGQMAKCPVCHNTFTAPELPAPPAAGFVPPPPPPSPPAGPPAPAVTPPPAVAPALHPFDGQEITPPPSVPAPPREAAAPAPHAPSGAALTHPAPAGSPAPAEYTRRWSAHLHPSVLQALAVLAVLGVFVLSFFPWVGRYPGGVPLATQSAWQAAFGSETVDDELQKLPDLRLGPDGKTEEAVGASGLMILFVLLLIPTLLVTLAAALWDLFAAVLPARLQGFKRWRWGIAAALLLLTLVFLVLQEVSGFRLETRTTAEVDRQMEGLEKKAAAPGARSAGVKVVAMMRGLLLSQLHRTAALTWVTWLITLALACALLVFWVERRGSRPLPRVDLLS
jgi:hypothetical protein